MVNGLIIPRSYNDYFSRSDLTQFNNAVRNITDATLNAASVNPIQNKAVAEIVPPQASSSNKLADKEFVNSSVSTNTANYISDNGEPFQSVAALEAYNGTVTNNDYAFVTGTDSAGNVYYDRYKATVNGASVSWAKEYRLNNSSFTAAQWAAIQSGITAEKVAQYDTFTHVIDDTQVSASKAWSSEKTSSFATAGVVCTTAAATQTKAVTLAGFTLAAGACIRVMFTNENTAANPELQINSETAKAIKVIQHGQKVAIPRHQGYWRGGASLTYEVWQPNTILELFYDGTDFIVIGNPIVESYEDTVNNKNYIVYADGFIEQSYAKTSGVSSYFDFNYPVVLNTITYFGISKISNSSAGSSNTNINSWTVRSIDTEKANIGAGGVMTGVAFIVKGY